MEKREDDKAATRTLTERLTSSRFIAPFALIATGIISLATFTNALSSLWAFFGFNKPHYAISAGGPIYDMPKLNGRTLDGCILTAKSQIQTEGDPDACNISAGMEIASQFCTVAGYPAARTFARRDTGVFQNSYKLAHVLTGDGQLNFVWNVDQRGGFIFTSITCQ